ncbi:HrpB1 family type III secretion system apparatus protein [Paraburkholderia sp. A1RI_3L]|uniref:HrpB1 family type III secretion system apparatus protein n=1 Tax=Paraburkholderia TaxID=1822464 RepID=UPI000477C6FA|nr:HrpB1 family type III secretion system apparatus protein [Paraburkholderia kururiensis]
MSVTSPNYLNCSPDIVGGLIETVSTALLSNFPKVEADPYDIELVLDALRVLRPKVAEIDTFEGIIHMTRGHWDDAVRVFSRVVENAPHFAYAKALLAFCLSVKGDPNWRQSAAEAVQANPSRDTQQLVRALEAREDLLDAVRKHRNGGPLEIPLSVTTLNDEEEERAATASPQQSTRQPQDPLAQQGYQGYLRA